VADHGTRAGYKQGCKCGDCRAANADYVRGTASYMRQYRRSKALAGGDELPSWRVDLEYEARAHDVRRLPYRRRLAMTLRRSAEIIRDCNGYVVAGDALVQLLYEAAGELDCSTR
jgi:hypothetical protein